MKLTEFYQGETQEQLLDRIFVDFGGWSSTQNKMVTPKVFEYEDTKREKVIKIWKLEDFKRKFELMRLR